MISPKLDRGVPRPLLRTTSTTDAPVQRASMQMSLETHILRLLPAPPLHRNVCPDFQVVLTVLTTRHVPATQDSLRAHQNPLIVLQGPSRDDEGAAKCSAVDVAHSQDRRRLGWRARKWWLRVVIVVAQVGDVDDFLGRDGLRRVMGVLERVERAVEGEPCAARHPGGGTLAVDGVGAGVPLDDLEGVALVVPDLPSPEHEVDEAVVEEEDWVKGGRVVLAHVAVGAGGMVEVALLGDVEAADGEVDRVVRRLEGDDGLEASLAETIVVPALGRGGVGEDGVVGCLEAILELVVDAGWDQISIAVFEGGELEPCDDVVVQHSVCLDLSFFTHFLVVDQGILGVDKP